MDIFKRFFGGKKGAKPEQSVARSNIINSIEERTQYTMSIVRENSEVIKHMKFQATMQMRVPLRVLLRHGEIHTDLTKPPPQIALELWEGLWGMVSIYDYDVVPHDLKHLFTCASDIGQIPRDGGEYLKFIIEIRKIIESYDSIDHRIEKLRVLLANKKWQVFVNIDKRNADWIVDRFFPRFVTSIPKVSTKLEGDLCRLGLDTANRITAASDETLLGISGIGQAKLQVIREHCNSVKENRDANRTENVIR